MERERREREAREGERGETERVSGLFHSPNSFLLLPKK
jgi:hypothetical protein